MKTYNVTLNEEQLEFLRDMIEGMLEKMDEDITYYQANPDELSGLSEPGEDPVTLEDFKASRDEMRAFLKVLPTP